jgi:hypothetical protein
MAKKKTFKTGLQQIVIDEETGEIVRQTLTTEIVEGYTDVKLPNKARLNNGGFITLFQSAMLIIAKNYKKSFTKDEGAVLFYLIGIAGLGNSISIDYPELVEELGMQRPNAVTAIKSLERKNILIVNKERGSRRQNESLEMRVKVNFDQLNYNLAYNGKIIDFSKVKHDHPPLKIANSEGGEEKQLSLLDEIEERKREK